MPRTGRPIIGLAKNENIKCRLDSNLLNEVYLYCDLEGLSISEVVRISLREFLLKRQ